MTDELATDLKADVTPPPPGPRRRRWLARLTIVSGAVFIAAFLATLWLVASTAGATLLLSAAGLKATGLEGSFLGPLRAQAIEYRRPTFVVTVERADFDWTPVGLLQGRFQVTYLSADAVNYSVATPATKAQERASLPETLKPPLAIRVEKADVKRIRIATFDTTGRDTPRFEVSEFELRSAAGSLTWAFERVSARTPVGLVEASGTVGAIRPFPVDVTVKASAERDGRSYRIAGAAKGTLAKFEAIVRGEEGGITGSATVAFEPFEDFPVKRVRGKLEGIDAAAFAPAAPRTRLSLEADLAPAKDGAFTGPVRIANAEPGTVGENRVPVTSASGTIRIQAPRYELRKATIALTGGGSAAGDIVVEGQQVEAKLVVAALDLAAWHAKLRPTKLAGEIVASATPRGQHFQVQLKEPRFEISGRAVVENQRLTVEPTRVERGASSAVLQGTLELKGQREFDFSATLDHLDPSAFAQLPAGEVSGKARAKGTLEGALAGELALELAQSTIAGLPLSGRATITGAQNRVSRVDLDLVLADAKLQAQGAFGRTGDTLDVKLVAPDLAPIGKAFKVAIAGSANVEARLTGTFAAPAGTLNATAHKLLVPGGFTMASANANLELGAQADARVDGTAEVTGLTRRTDAGLETIAERAKVTLAGTRAQHRATLDATLPPESRIAAATTVGTAASSGSRRLQVALQGGLVDKAAAATWRGRIESAALAGPNPIRLTAPATLTLARDLVEIGDAVLRGEIGSARFALTRWTPARIEARGSSEGLLTRPIVRALGLPAQARSNLVLAAEWDIKATETLDGFVRVRRVQGDIRVGEPPVTLGIEELTVSAEATRGQVRAALVIRGTQVGRIEARGTTVLRREGSAWTLPREAPLSGDVDANVPTLAWASDWFGPDARLDGRIRGKVALGGTLAAPTYRGNVSAEGVQLRDPSFGFEIDEGVASVALNEREVVIERLELASAWRESSRVERRLAGVHKPEKGTITAQGRLDFGSRSGAITVRMQSYPVAQLPSRFIAASGEAKIEAREGGINVTGAFKADAGLFSLAGTASPSLSDDVLVDRGEGIPDKPKQRINIDLRFSLGEALYFSGRGLATRLAGELRVRGDPGRSLVASGQIRTEGGTYDAYGQKLAIERGVLTFQGPIDNPALNVLAVRGGMPIVAGVEILGAVNRPSVRLYSRPEVPDHEKLAWLVLGRGPGDASEGDTAILFAAANAMFGLNRENRRLFRQLGFDDFSIGRAGSGSALGTLPQSTVAGRTGATAGGEVLTVGKRLTKDLYVSYQQGLADAQATVRFAYQVTRRLQLLLIAGDNTGVDAVYRFTFD